MTLKIISSVDTVFEGEVESVTLPGEKGQFTVLNHHASLISTLSPGEIRYTEANGKVSSTKIDGGIVDVDNNLVSVCVK